MATMVQAKEFIKTIGPLAAQVCKERGYGNAQAWTCIAQACCESGYGTSAIMKNANAFFGVKATSSWVKAAKYGGKVYNASTKECYDGKTYTNITACFRAYNDMVDSIRDYFDLIEMDRYKASLSKTTVKDAITCIKNGGYATSPTYINTICSVYNQFKAEIEVYTVAGATTSANTGSAATRKKSDKTIAKEVIAGKWGNGADRKRRLTEAGYNYSAIQKIVNEMVK